MPDEPTSHQEHIQLHKDGSVWAKGQTADGVPNGYWEWFRLDGTKMRSGHFENGEQAGEWTTYDKAGKVYKVSRIKPK
jgi:antitoxin component YwqK of YwqJK toxin-antitoxin module